MQLKIHKEGWVYFIILLIISIISFPFIPFIGLTFSIITIYLFYFFRDPIRSVPFEDLIISPADGVVTYVGESEPPINIDIIQKKKFVKISIFLSIFNVHVNRIPSTGIIKKIKYINGKFINATLDKSSKDNERNIIVLEKDNDDLIIITQIAGLIARRIVCEVKETQKVNQGHRFGIIKFGSRVDLYMPLHYKPLINVGQIAVGGETILANPNNVKEITKTIKI